MKRGNWTPEEIDYALSLYAEGTPYSEIGLKLDRASENVRRIVRKAREARGLPLDTQRPSGKSQLWLERYLEATEGWPKMVGDSEVRDRRFVRAVVLEAISTGLI